MPAGRHAEQVFEVVEVDVDRPQRDARTRRDLAGRRPQMALGEEVEKRVGDRVSGRRFASRATVCDGGRCHDRAMYE